MRDVEQSGESLLCKRAIRTVDSAWCHRSRFVPSDQRDEARFSKFGCPCQHRGAEPRIAMQVHDHGMRANIARSEHSGWGAFDTPSRVKLQLHPLWGKPLRPAAARLHASGQHHDVDSSRPKRNAAVYLRSLINVVGRSDVEWLAGAPSRQPVAERTESGDVAAARRQDGGGNTGRRDW